MVDERPRITAVVPVRDRAELLARCLRSLTDAAAQYGPARIIVSDNASTDDSVAVARAFGAPVSVIHSPATRVGGVRNDGANADLETDVYAFIDCDCVVPEDFFSAVADTLALTGAAAVGCEVLSRPDGHWTERAWDGLHRPGGDGPRHYINSACFCIRADWYHRINGFDAEKISSEDVDICRRLSNAGGAMWQSERLAVLHLGNPQSVAGLYRRIRWHGEGAWAPVNGMQWSVTSIATLAHGVLALAGLSLGAMLGAAGHIGIGLLTMLAGLLITPLLFVLARAMQHRRAVPLVGGVALMSVTFPARLHGLFRSMMKRRVA